MGIAINQVHILGKVFKNYDFKNKLILTLGVQDCYFSFSDIISFFKKHNINYEKISHMDIQLTDGFKWVNKNEKKFYEKFIHQKTLFQLLGFKKENIFSLDVSDYENPNFNHDMNLLVPEKLCNKFDFIFDGGTMEHVFDIKQFMENIHLMLKANGIIYHDNPCHILNHGFYNFNFEFYSDFYLTNFYKDIYLKYCLYPNHPFLMDKYYYEFEPKEHYHFFSAFFFSVVIGIFQKNQNYISKIQIPQQGFYQKIYNENDNKLNIYNKSKIKNFFKKIRFIKQTYQYTRSKLNSFLIIRLIIEYFKLKKIKKILL